jgi:hypothetical protein
MTRTSLGLASVAAAVAILSAASPAQEAASRPAVLVELSVVVNRSFLNPKLGTQIQSSTWKQDAQIAEIAKTGAGGRIVRVSFGHASIGATHPLFGPVGLDTRTPPPPEQLNPSTMIMMAYYLGYAGRELSLTLDAHGAIVAVEGLEAIRDAMIALGESTPQFKAFAHAYKAMSEIYFSEASAIRFLQPFFPPTVPKDAAVGWKAPPSKRHFIYTEPAKGVGVEWASEFEVKSATSDRWTLWIGGSEERRTPHVYDDPKRSGGEGRRPATPADPNGKAHLLKRTASGEGSIDRADGFWSSLDYAIEAIEEKPAFDPTPGPHPNDERRSDRFRYLLKRVEKADFPPGVPSNK